MKKIILVLISCILSSCVWATDIAVLFSQGNNYFLHGQFERARHMYEQINPKTSIVWHNIGNCFFNEKKYAQALVCWKRAVVGADWKQFGQLCSAESKALQALHLPIAGWRHDTLQKIYYVVPKIMIKIVLCILFFILLLLFYRYQKKLRSNLINRLSIFLILFGIFVGLWIWYQQHKILNQKIAFIVKENSSLYAGPEISFHKIKSLPLGSQVEIQDYQQGMYKIYENTQQGWIIPDEIEIV